MRTKISDYIVGIVVFMLFITAGVSLLSIYHSADSNFGGTKFAQFNSSFNRLSELNRTVGGLSSGLNATSSTDFGAFGVLNSLINKGWQTLRLIGSSFGFMNSVFASIPSFFGIPSFIVVFISMIIMIIIVFAIWSAIFRTDL